ncbi:hypothetical protein HUT19_06590 [Streptomyces sp. NA02950]|uniref:hypothetical protein n=1 Tax=Streptomyces sp. NA02950 TaxID=2742137 RepID=UPI001591CDD7|nr:hypothetical protein [Streptomyces sp. NA02950]QKV91454.1 hypothetical protein HUT19_06590 [Streptomyces sp. NA02950]
MTTLGGPAGVARSERAGDFWRVSPPGDVLRLPAVTGTDGYPPQCPDLASAQAAIGGG